MKDVVWAVVVRGSVGISPCIERPERELIRSNPPRGTKQNEPGPVNRPAIKLDGLGNWILNLLDAAVTWAVGDEPTHKEQITWTSSTFKCQRRVRKGTLSGRGFCKRMLGTTDWFQTAAVICLMSTSGHAKDTCFDSDSVQIHVDYCRLRCITNLISDFVTTPQKVIGGVKGMGGNKVAVSAVGTIRWTFNDDSGTSHALLIPGSLFTPKSPARLFLAAALGAREERPFTDKEWHPASNLCQSRVPCVVSPKVQEDRPF